MAMPIEQIATAGWVARPPQPLRILKVMLPLAALAVAAMVLATVWVDVEGHPSRLWAQHPPGNRVVADHAPLGETWQVYKYLRHPGTDRANLSDAWLARRHFVEGPSTGQGMISWSRSFGDRIALAEIQADGQCTAAVLYPETQFIAIRPVAQLQHQSCDARLITALDADPAR